MTPLLPTEIKLPQILVFVAAASSMFKVAGSLQSKSTRRDVGTATSLFIPHECSKIYTILHSKL